MGFTLYQMEILPGLPKKLAFEEDGFTIGALFHLLSSRYGKNALAGVLDREGNIEEGKILVLNGVSIKSSQALQTVIPAESELLIADLIAGG